MQLTTSSQRGATLVEFAVIMTLLVFMSSLIIELGLGMQRYGTASGIVISAVRTGATSMCSELLGSSVTLRPNMSIRESFTANKLESELQQALGSNSVISAIDENAVNDSLDVPDVGRMLTVSVQVRVNCFFCSLVPGGLDFDLKGQARIEDLDSDCLSL